MKITINPPKKFNYIFTLLLMVVIQLSTPLSQLPWYVWPLIFLPILYPLYVFVGFWMVYGVGMSFVGIVYGLLSILSWIERKTRK